MGTEALIRAADVFFTASLLLIAGLGVVLAWAMGSLIELSLAMLVVALVAPYIHRALPARA